MQDTSSSNLPERVTGSDGKSYLARRPVPSATAPIEDGESNHDDADVSSAPTTLDFRKMSDNGWTSEEVARKVGLDVTATRATLEKEGIRVPADEAKVVEKIDTTVWSVDEDAKRIWTDVESIDLAHVDPEQQREWSASLSESIDLLEKLRRLV